jgi:hypothetical protein
MTAAMCLIVAWIFSYPWSSGVIAWVRPVDSSVYADPIAAGCRLSLSQQDGRVHLSHIGPLGNLFRAWSPNYRVLMDSVHMSGLEMSYASSESGFGWWLAGFDAGVVIRNGGNVPQRDVAIPHWFLVLLLLWFAYPLLRRADARRGFPVAPDDAPPTPTVRPQ